jgi:hypothetical protein
MPRHASVLLLTDALERKPRFGRHVDVQPDVVTGRHQRAQKEAGPEAGKSLQEERHALGAAACQRRNGLTDVCPPRSVSAAVEAERRTAAGLEWVADAERPVCQRAAHPGGLVCKFMCGPSRARNTSRASGDRPARNTDRQRPSAALWQTPCIGQTGSCNVVLGEGLATGKT